MPSGFAAIDTGFPDLGKYDSTEQKLQAMEDYLVQLLENLRYTLHNLGVENLNVSSVKELGDIITEPIRAEIDDPDTGLSARIDANAAAISTEVTRATGEEAALQQTADGIKAQVTDGQGNYTVLNLKSGGLYVGNAQGATQISGSNITAGSVTANEIASRTITAAEIAAGTVTANEIAANTITGAEIAANAITAGKISADALNGYDIYGAKYHDSDNMSTLDITSGSSWWRLLFGESSGSGLSDTSFAIDADPADGYASLYLAGKLVLSVPFAINHNALYIAIPMVVEDVLKIGNQDINWGQNLPTGLTAADAGRVFFKI